MQMMVYRCTRGCLHRAKPNQTMMYQLRYPGTGTSKPTPSYNNVGRHVRNPSALVDIPAGAPEDTALIAQLEKAINSSNISLSELDTLLGISATGTPGRTNNNTPLPDVSERMAIDAIQDELMRMESGNPNARSNNMPSVSSGLEGLSNLSKGLVTNSSKSGMQTSSSTPGVSVGQFIPSSSGHAVASHLGLTNTMLQELHKNPSGRPQGSGINVREQLVKQIQQQSFQQMNFGPRGPRFTPPQGQGK